MYLIDDVAQQAWCHMTCSRAQQRFKLCSMCANVSLMLFDAFYFASLLPRPDAALTWPPEEKLSNEDTKPGSTAAAVEKETLPPLGVAVTTEKDGPADSKPKQENLTEDKGMELMDAHEEGAHSESKEQALIRLQNFIWLASQESH